MDNLEQILSLAQQIVALATPVVEEPEAPVDSVTPSETVPEVTPEVTPEVETPNDLNTVETPLDPAV